MKLLRGSDMKNVLVTAIYSYSPHTRMGGRGYNMQAYMAPFMNVMNLGLHVVIFTHDAVYDDLQKFLTQYEYTNYTIIKFDLNTTDITDKILKLKQSAGIIDDVGLTPGISLIQNDRNHVLCLKKPFFLRKVIEEYVPDADNYYWIDAGLFHHGLFPDSLGGMERYINIEIDRFWPNNKKSLFCPGLIESLTEQTIDNFIFIKTHTYYGQPNWWNIISPNAYKNGHIVGGLFGGKKEVCIELIDTFYQYLEVLLDHNILSLEEEILSAVYANKLTQLGAFNFTSWYHDVEGDRCYLEQPPNTECFYKIFIR